MTAEFEDRLSRQLSAEDLETYRHVLEGLGWYCELRFCASASSRPFVARTALQGDAVLEVHARRGADPTFALRDLIEVMALDDNEVIQVDERVDLSTLPRWELDGVGSFYSRAKAAAAQAELARVGKVCDLRQVTGAES